MSHRRQRRCDKQHIRTQLVAVSRLPSLSPRFDRSDDRSSRSERRTLCLPRHSADTSVLTPGVTLGQSSACPVCRTPFSLSDVPSATPHLELAALAAMRQELDAWVALAETRRARIEVPSLDGVRGWEEGEDAGPSEGGGAEKDGLGEEERRKIDELSRMMEVRALAGEQRRFGKEGRGKEV